MFIELLPHIERLFSSLRKYRTGIEHQGVVRSEPELLHGRLVLSADWVRKRFFGSFEFCRAFLFRNLLQ